MFQAPAVSRKLWFYQSAGGQIDNDGVQPLDATVCYVNSDGTVNLAIRDMYGVPHTRHNVVLVQDGGPTNECLDYWCEWMPYQAKQFEKQIEREGANIHGIGPDIGA